jgi:hypothetical protein
VCAANRKVAMAGQGLPYLWHHFPD